MTHPAGIRRTDSPFHDPVQSCRFFEVDSHWFFLTREKAVQGPFSTRNSAETALDVYIAGLTPDRTMSSSTVITSSEINVKTQPPLQSSSVEEFHRKTAEGATASWNHWKR